METAVAKTLGVASFDDKIFVCYVSKKNKANKFSIDYSTDGKSFTNLSNDAKIESTNGLLDLSNISSFRFFKIEDSYNLYFITRDKNGSYLNVATSRDFTNWESKGRLFPITEPAVQIPYFTHKNREIIFFGGTSLNVGYSDDSKNWNIKYIDVPKSEYILGTVQETHDGIHLIYFLKQTHDEHVHYSVWSVLLDREDPTQIIWKTDTALWYQPQEWIDKRVVPVGIVNFKNTFYSYWELAGQGVYSVCHDQTQKFAEEKSELPHAKLIRHADNPILSPGENKMWDSKQVFNAAAVEHNGKVHLLYRAIGDSDTSVLGYAATSDGLTIDERSDRPAYIPRAYFEHPNYGQKIKVSPYESGGGGYGGIEDPRISKIDNKFYLTYVAYDGTHPPRVALSYISIKDFEDKDWSKWSDPILISPPGVVDKNACILPEKVNGKYVVFHRIYPDILIDMVDDLDFDGKDIWLKGVSRIHPRPDFWDSNKVGMGPPPIKTKDGWLAIYQAVGFQDNGRYKIGAMLLDLNDPSKVLFRSSYPVLEPETFYENQGFKSGVIYPCGSVIINNTLIVYYGGSDTYLAAATANLDQFLDELKFDNSPHLDVMNFANILNTNA